MTDRPALAPMTVSGAPRAIPVRGSSRGHATRCPGIDCPAIRRPAGPRGAQGAVLSRRRQAAA